MKIQNINIFGHEDTEYYYSWEWLTLTIYLVEEVWHNNAYDLYPWIPLTRFSLKQRAIASLLLITFSVTKVATSRKAVMFHQDLRVRETSRTESA